jgi:DNA modification methylase
MRMRWAGYVVHMGYMRKAYKILIGKPEVERLHVSPRLRWGDNIKIYVREIGFYLVDWIFWLKIKTCCGVL